MEHSATGLGLVWGRADRGKCRPSSFRDSRIHLKGVRDVSESNAAIWIIGSATNFQCIAFVVHNFYCAVSYTEVAMSTDCVLRK